MTEQEIKELKEKIAKIICDNTMKKWRPEGWNNPYKSDYVALQKRIKDDTSGGYVGSIPEKLRDNLDNFEAGADAMLDGLRSEYPQTKISEIEIKGGKTIHGLWVFIPDDEV